MEGKSLDEGASIQEISEQILYYHRDQKWSSGSSFDPPTPRTKNSRTEEAVQFLGLCSALYGLPSSLGDDDQTEERTKQIYFGKSTLVFVTLESCPSLLAVAQISRLYQQGSKSGNGGGNPLAIRASIERCHSLFCLLRGGGVLGRLEPNIHVMGGLYRLLKTIRKEKEQHLKSGSTATGQDEEKFNGKIAELQDELKALRKRLPIQSIRRDLDAHYKEYLAHQSLAIARNGGAGRCLVESIPEPIPSTSGTDILNCSWSQQSKFSITTLGLRIRNLFDEFALESGPMISLLGISTFVYGELIHTHWSDISIPTRIDSGASISGCIVARKEQVHLLMSHIASYGVKMLQMTSSKQEFATNCSQLGIKNIALSLGESASSYSSSRGDTIGDSSSTMGEFVPPPPPFMLNAIEEASFIEISSQRKAWALTVYLPVRVAGEELTKEFSYKVHAVVYEVERYRFLLFFDVQYQTNVSNLLLVLESKLKDVVIRSEEKSLETIFPHHDQPPSFPFTEAGQDIVIINREQNKLYLFSDRKQPARKDRKKTSSKGSSRRFLGFITKSHSISGDWEQSRPPPVEWATLGLDCRHLLASHLHLDTMLAFDDMMNEISRRKESQASLDTESMHSECEASRSSIVELCTCMPLGWIYAFAAEETELYAFFDSSIYVTVADVQNAATRIQEQFFGRHDAEPRR